MHTIASNAGADGAVVVAKLLEQDNLDLGYDAAKGRTDLLTSCFCSLLQHEDFVIVPIVIGLIATGVDINTSLNSFRPGAYVDMVNAGIIDPVKVIRTALVDAAR